MIALVLAGLALAQSPTVSLQSTAEVRHDLFGERLLPFAQYVRLEHVDDGGVGVHGNVGVQWLSGVDHPGDPELYTLHVDGPTKWGGWSVGRQQALAAMRMQTFDGAKVDVRRSRALWFTAWGGVARHHDLDDLSDGVAIGRVEAHYRAAALMVRAGVQAEDGANTAGVLREDLEAWWAPRESRLQPRVGARLVMAQPNGPVEWARLEAGLRPVSALGLSVYGQHREVVDTGALFGDKLLDALSGGSVTEVGGRASAVGAGFATATAQYALVTYGRVDGAQFGHRVDLRWAPPRRSGAVLVLPAYAFRSGPGGLYHAAYTTVRLRLGEDTNLAARGALVPFRKGRGPWDLVADLRLEGDRQLVDGLRLAAHVDAATDRINDLDVRAGATLWVELR